MNKSKAINFISLSFLITILFLNYAYSKPITEIQQAGIKKLRVLSPNNLPLKVLAVHASKLNNTGFITELAKIIIDINETDKAPAKDILKFYIVTGLFENTKAALKNAGIKDEIIKKTVEFTNQAGSGDDIWMQDWGEIAMAITSKSEEPKLLIMDSNRGRGLAELPGMLAKFWNADYFKLSASTARSGDHGGNIEVTPDDVLIVGDTASPATINTFKNCGYESRMAVVESKWLAVGHCDEYISIAPNLSSPSGYSIFYADPELALGLIKNARPEQLTLSKEQAAYAEGAKLQNYIIALNRVLNERGTEEIFEAAGIVKSLDTGNNNDGTSAFNAYDIDGITLKNIRRAVEDNRKLSAVIRKNVETIIKKIDEVRGTPSGLHSIIAFPVLYERYGMNSDKFISMFPNTVNMLSLRNHLVIARPYCGVFEEYIAKTVKNSGLKAHFIDDLIYHINEGDVHCGTNVIRHPNRYVIKPSYLPQPYKEYAAKHRREKEIAKKTGGLFSEILDDATFSRHYDAMNSGHSHRCAKCGAIFNQDGDSDKYSHGTYKCAKCGYNEPHPKSEPYIPSFSSPYEDPLYDEGFRDGYLAAYYEFYPKGYCGISSAVSFGYPAAYSSANFYYLEGYREGRRRGEQDGHYAGKYDARK